MPSLQDEPGTRHLASLFLAWNCRTLPDPSRSKVFQPKVFQPKIFRPKVFRPKIFRPKIFQLKFAKKPPRLCLPRVASLTLAATRGHRR